MDKRLSSEDQDENSDERSASTDDAKKRRAATLLKEAQKTRSTLMAGQAQATGVEECNDLLAKICKAERQNTIDRKDWAWKLSILKEKNQRLKDELSQHQQLVDLVMKVDKKIDEFVEARARLRAETDDPPKGRALMTAATLSNTAPAPQVDLVAVPDEEVGDGRAEFEAAMEEFDRMHDKNLEMQGQLLEMKGQHMKKVLEMMSSRGKRPIEQKENIYNVLEEDFELKCQVNERGRGEYSSKQNDWDMF